MFSGQTLSLAATSSNVVIDITDTSAEVTIGTIETTYSDADYSAIDISSSSSTNTNSITVNDQTSTGKTTAGISWGQLAVGAPSVSITASNFYFEAFNGNASRLVDTASYSDTSMSDQFFATINPGGTSDPGSTPLASLMRSMNSSGSPVYSDSANNLLIVAANSSGQGSDTALFQDAVGGANFNSNPTANEALLTNGTAGLWAKTIGFVQVEAATAVANNRDNATLSDTSGNDTFTAIGASAPQGNYAQLEPSDASGAYYYIVSGFYDVNAYSINGGTDKANLTDSGGGDTFIGTPEYSSISLANAYTDFAEFHNTVTATGSGGHDGAFFYTSGGGTWTQGAAGTGALSTISSTGSPTPSTVSSIGFDWDSETVEGDQAPVIAQGTTVQLPAVSELTAADDPTDPTNIGESVWNLIGGQLNGIVADPTHINLVGIAITSANETNGQWQYITGASDWQDFGAVSSNTALLLAADGTTRIRFLPNKNYAGSPSITFVGWNHTDGSGNTAYRSAGAYSQYTAIASVTVNPPPTINGLGTQDIAQNQPLTFSAANGDAMSLVDSVASGADEQLTLTPTNGTLALGSTTGLTSVSGAGTTASPLVAVGTLASLNTALAGMVFTPTADFNNGAASIAVGIADQGDGENASGTISISVAADQASILTQTATTASFTAGGSPVAIDSGITVADADNATLSSATVTIGDYVSGEDELISTSNLPSHIKVSNVGGVYTFTGTDASPGDFQSVLRSLAYEDLSSTPTTTTRTLSIFVNDGQLNSNTATYAINVSAASGGSDSPTAPTIFFPSAQSVAAGGSLAFSWDDGNAISVADPEIGGGTDTMALGVSDGVLNLASLTGSTGNGTDSVSVTGTLAAIDAALDGLTYTPNAGADNDSLAMILTDGTQTANGSVSIDVEAAPAQPPVLAPSVAAVYYSPGAEPVKIDSGITLTDSDNITGAIVSISAGYVSGDSLVLNDQSGIISGDFNTTTDQLALSGLTTATAADYEAALQSITFQGSDTSATDPRTISVTVTDSALNTASAGYTINVVPASSTLAISAPVSQSVNEGDSLMFALSGGNPISIAGPNFTTDVDSMSLKVSDGTLYLGTSAGLTSSGNGTANISLSGTLAAIDAALDGLEYFPGADYVSYDPLTLTLTDSTAQQSTTATVGVSISPAVPAPNFSLGPDQTIPIGVGEQTIPGWASGMTAGLPDDSNATLNFVVSKDSNPALFAQAPSIDPNGDLTYEPAAGANGSATISVVLRATPASGGAAVESAESDFTITLGADVQPQLITPPLELIAADSELDFGAPAAGGIYIAGDTETSTQVTVNISTTIGWLNNHGGTSCVVSGGNSSSLTLSGSIADINTELATLNLNPTNPQVSDAGSATITVSLTWAAVGEEGGSQTVTNVIPLTIVDPTAAGSTEISISVPSDQAVPENQWLAFSGNTGNAITINADPADEAEVTISSNTAVSAVSLTNRLTLGSTDGLTMIAGSGDGENIETFTGTIAEINAALDGLEFTSVYSAPGPEQITLIATLLDDCGDPIGTPAAASTTINFRHAPYFNDYLGLWLNDQPQLSDEYTVAGDIQGTQVGALLYETYGSIGTEDLDANSNWGIAVTGLDSQNGTWQFSWDGGGGQALDGSSDWQDIDADSLSDTNALLLNSTDYLRFVPNKTSFTGDISDAVTFRLWDETTGTDRKFTDVSENGGTTAFSATAATAALRINPVQTPPAGAQVGVGLTGTFASDGTTLQVSLSNEQQGNIELTWTTADGTAKAGPDYQSNGGSISSGQDPTVDISIKNFNGDGTLGFYIIVTPSNTGTSTYYPVTIPANMQLLADSNDDGRIDTTEDVAANAAALKNDSGGVLVNPDPDNDPTTNQPGLPGYDPSNYGQALVTSGRLVEVALALDFNSAFQSGATFNLTATGDTNDFVFWADPSRTEQINVTGGSNPETIFDMPGVVWIEEPVQLTAGATPPAITLILAMQNPSGSAPPPSEVRVQAAAPAKLQAEIVKDDPSSEKFNTPSGKKDMLADGQTAYVPLDNDYDANNPTRTDLQVYNGPKLAGQKAVPQLSSTEDDLLPIVITGTAGQGGYYTINANLTQLRIWLPNPAAPGEQWEYLAITNSTPLRLGADGTLTLYVEGIQSGAQTISVTWHGAGAQANLAPTSNLLKIAVFKITGPRSVPENTTYSYEATGGSSTGAFVQIPPVNGQQIDVGGSNTNAQGIKGGNAIDTTTVTWGAGPRFGKLDYSASPNYTWAVDVAIVDIQFNLQASQFFTAVNAPAGQQSDSGPSQVGSSNLIDSISSWKNNPNAPPASIPPAMTATVDVSQIVGPTRTMVMNGVQSLQIYGVKNINIGFIQTVVANIPMVPALPAGVPVLDKLTRTLTPGSTYNNFKTALVPQATLNIGPWEDAGNQTYKPAQVAYAAANNASNLAPGKFGAFLSGQQAGSPPAGGFQNVFLAVTDTPSRWPVQVAFNAISGNFTLQVAVSIAGQGAPPPNQNKYWSEVSGTWSVTYVGNYDGVDWTTNIPPSSQVTIQSPFTISPPATAITIPAGPVFNTYLK